MVEGESAFEEIKEIEEIAILANTRSSSVIQSPEIEEPTEGKMYEEGILLIVTTSFFICLLVMYWDSYTDKWIIIPTYTLQMLVLLFKRDFYGLDKYLLTIIAIFNTLFIILFFLFLSSQSHYFSESFHIDSRFLQLRFVLYVFYTLLMNIRIAKRANRIVTISRQLETISSVRPGIGSHGMVVLKTAHLNETKERERSSFIKEHLVNRIENYSGDSLYFFLIAIISFFSYQVIPLERGESYTGHFVSVMLLVSTELVILAIYDLTIRNRELDAIEFRYDTNFVKGRVIVPFCGVPVPWFRLLRTVKMQPLSLLILFFGTVTIIFFALD